jgi:hypothetical protein
VVPLLGHIVQQTFPWVVPLGNHLAKITWKLDPIFFSISSTYALVYLIGLGGLCFPHLCTHSWKIMSTQKPIICINILILNPFFTQFLTFLKIKCPYTYTLVIFSCLFNTYTREWSELTIKIKKDENSYHLCSWHQWPFKTSWSWLQKSITKWKLIQSTIYKRHHVGWHLKYS